MKKWAFLSWVAGTIFILGGILSLLNKDFVWGSLSSILGISFIIQRLVQDRRK